MNLTFCKKYSFDEKKRQARLAALGLGVDEYKLANQLQKEVIEPELDELIIRFIRILRLDEEVNQAINSGFREDKYILFLRNYLQSLGINFEEGSYFEQRLRIGIAHVNAGISMSILQIAFRLLQQLLIDSLPEQGVNQPLLTAFVLKITTLDLIIASEVFEHYRLPEDGNKIRRHRGSVQQLVNMEQLNALLAVMHKNADATKSIYVGVLKIDDERKIQQCYGENTANDVKRGIVLRILATLRPGDGIGQLHDHSFVFVLTDINRDSANDICKRLMSSITSHPVSADKMTIPVTISVVLVRYPHQEIHQQLLRDLMQRLADLQQKGTNQLELLIDEDSGG